MTAKTCLARLGRPVVVEVKSKSKQRRDQVNIRPISIKWRSDNGLVTRKPAYRTAIANVAYVWRDSQQIDQFGKMPLAFEARRFEIVHAGMMLPKSAPLWACREPYSIWREADYHSSQEADPCALSAWHVVLSLPTEARDGWKALVERFVGDQLVGRGAAVAWAIHACQGEDGDWLVHPHAHLIVSARTWRRTSDWGKRQTHWLGNRAQQARFKSRWQDWLAYHEPSDKQYKSE